MAIAESFGIFSLFIFLKYIITYVYIQSYADDVINAYVVDDTYGVGRRFDGIGAISGGGATSKLLINYKEPYRSQILDYLFKPSFGASLQILKVEIGGDSQSTDGSESSHMHDINDLNFHRGYEWWLLKEAKKRNPQIKLYGLPWVFPGWLGGDDFNPFHNRTYMVKYIMNWIRGAKQVHNLDIDYIGIWNERSYDIEYVKMLRQALNSAGLERVEIVVADGGWGVVNDLIKDPDFLEAVSVIGAHYPGSQSPISALALDRPLWSSEEYSAFNDLHGGGCWARVLNEGYVNGHLTATIAWNLIASYYDNLPYSKSSLMTADQPWSGHYEVSSPIWMTAHHTQFTFPGWHYLPHSSGVGNLTNNGSYTALVSPDRQHLTIIITTMDPTFAHCFYPMPVYNISAEQSASFKLEGSFASIDQFFVWYSRIDGNSNVFFKQSGTIKPHNGVITLKLRKNEVYTLTTLKTGQKGHYPSPPPPQDFPATYQDNFEDYPLSAEAFNLAQQAGSFEVVDSGDLEHGKVIQQMVPRPPVDTCRPERMTSPVALIGNYQWSDVQVNLDFLLKSSQGWADGVFVATRVETGGCYTMYSEGVFLYLYPQNKTALLSGNFTRSLIYSEASAQLHMDAWNQVSLNVQGNRIEAIVNNNQVFNMTIDKKTSTNGFVAFGTNSFSTAMFDNLGLSKTKVISSRKPQRKNFHQTLNRRFTS